MVDHSIFYKLLLQAGHGIFIRSASEQVYGGVVHQFQKQLCRGGPGPGVPDINDGLGHQAGKGFTGTQATDCVFGCLLQGHDGSQLPDLAAADGLGAIHRIAVGLRAVGQGAVITQERRAAAFLPQPGLGGFSCAGGSGKEDAGIADADLAGVEKKDPLAQQDLPHGYQPKKATQGIDPVLLAEIQVAQMVIAAADAAGEVAAVGAL